MRQDWQSCEFIKIGGIPARSCVALHELAEPIESPSELRVNSSATFARGTKQPKCHLPSNSADTYTECIKVVDLFVLADSDEQMF